MSQLETLRNLTECLEVGSKSDMSDLVLCPRLGGRVFAEICGEIPHRMDMEVIANPTQPFNNFGGLNFWPAPEGGKFGFNYDGDEWRVQYAINDQPFEVTTGNEGSVAIEKKVALVNKAGTVVDANMRRELSLSALPETLEGYRLKGVVSYIVTDTFEVLSDTSPEEALIAAWTLEQFNASDDTVSFCVVENPTEAINFDFYEHPAGRITCFSHGFTYRTDGKKAGQIGIKKSSSPSLIGFYDLARNMLCIRENLSIDDGLYFNIADNDQPEGPYSAADVYSMYNSDTEMSAFELETVGSVIVENGRLKNSQLVSRTTIVIFEEKSDIEKLVKSLIE